LIRKLVKGHGRNTGIQGSHLQADLSAMSPDGQQWFFDKRRTMAVRSQNLLGQ